MREKEKVIKRILSIFFNIIINCTLLFSQNIKYGYSYNYPSEYGGIIINKDSYTMKYLDGKEEIKTETHKSRIKDYYYFNFLEDIENTKEKYIILTCSFENLNFLTLVGSSGKSNNAFKNYEIYYNYCDDYKKYNSMPWLRAFAVQNAKSYLEERLKDGTIIKYLPESTWISNNPWAIKKDAEEKIICLEPYSPIYQNVIIIANGFISTEKPYLYEQNARPKKIRIICEKESKDIELQDTPNFQVLKISDNEKNYSGMIQLEVLEVYPGTKYSDVVISGIYYIDCY